MQVADTLMDNRKKRKKVEYVYDLLLDENAVIACNLDFDFLLVSLKYDARTVQFFCPQNLAHDLTWKPA